MPIEIIDPTQFPDWDSLILRHSEASFFHSAAWAKVLQKAYGFTPLYFTIFDGGLLSACLPVMEIDSFLTGRRGVSLPFSDYCEPFASSQEEFQELFTEAAEYGKQHRWKSLELRGGGSFLATHPSSSTYLLHTLDLTGGQSPNHPVTQSPDPLPPSAVDSQLATRNSQRGSADPQPVLPSAVDSQLATRNSQLLFSTFRESTRRSVKKARTTGVNLEILTSEAALKKFCRLNQITRREHGLPPQPYRFFEEVHRHVISKGHGFVAMASHGSEVVAASVYFHFGKTAIYKYGASHKRYQHLRPNNLVMWEAIRWCIEHGCTTLSLGRTDLGHEGLRQFKNGWGGQEHSINYYKCGLKAGEFIGGHNAAVGGLAGRAASLTPLPVLRAVGSLLYRHMG
jgi:hypothetical protein